MLTKDIRKTIDNARDVLVGKIPNPQSQIEQITIAMIYKFMDDMDLESVEFGGERQFFSEELEQYAWSKIMSKQLGNEARMNLYTEALEKLPLAKQIPQLFRTIFKGAYLPFRDGQTLTLFLKEINDLSYDNSENLGNAFEYLLSIMSSQGDAGQFRTPRHIIDFIVDVVNPTKSDTILDPACGTGGFLISAYKHILENAKNSDKVLNPTEMKTLTENIQGYDISPDMQKLALVNMYLHKFKEPKIYEYDTLTSLDKWDNYFDVILANPPFMTPKGGIQPHNKFGVKANRSEVLFVDYIMKHINSNGKAGVIVPEGIVFQSANAYKELRKKLVDENYLYAVVSLPSGIFQPYSGVKTSILLLDKQLAKRTDKVLFVEIKNDGYDLGAQRREIDKNDLSKALELIQQWQKQISSSPFAGEDRGEGNFQTISLNSMTTIIEKTKLSKNGEYNLTASRYKDTKDYSNCKWDMVKLGDVCELKRGTSITKKDIIDGNIPVIAGGQQPAYFHNEPNRIGETITIAGSGAYSGFVSYFNEPIFVSDAFSIKSLNNSICLTKYVYSILKVKQKYIYSLQSGMGVPHLYAKDLMNYEIPLPPIEVQEEIVKELDGYQAVIDGAKKVVDNWHPTLPTNPNWQKVKLGDVCELTYGYTDTAKDSGDARFIRITDIDECGKLKTEDRKYIDLSSESNKFSVNKQDILVARTGATYGKTVMFNEDYKAVYASFLIRLNFDKSKVYNPYYWAFAQSVNYIEQAKNLVSGGGQPQFNANAIKNIEFPLPDTLEEQQEIVAKIEEEEKIVEQCKKLIELHQQKINTKIQSILGDNCENNN